MHRGHEQTEAESGAAHSQLRVYHFFVLATIWMHLSTGVPFLESRSQHVCAVFLTIKCCATAPQKYDTMHMMMSQSS